MLSAVRNWHWSLYPEGEIRNYKRHWAWRHFPDWNIQQGKLITREMFISAGSGYGDIFSRQARYMVSWKPVFLSARRSVHRKQNDPGWSLSFTGDPSILILRILLLWGCSGRIRFVRCWNWFWGRGNENCRRTGGIHADSVTPCFWLPAQLFNGPFDPFLRA